MLAKSLSSLRLVAVSQDVFYLPCGGRDHRPYAGQLLLVHPSLAHLLSEELTEVHEVVPDLMDLGRDARIPASSELAPDILDGAPVLIQELPPLVRDGVDFLAVSLSGAHVLHVFEQLQRGVNGAGTRRVEPAGPLFQLPYNLVAVRGLVLEQVEDHVLQVPLLEHPSPPRTVADPRPVPPSEEPLHRLWAEHVLDLLSQTHTKPHHPSTHAGPAPRARTPTFPRAPLPPRDRCWQDPRASCSPPRRRGMSPAPLAQA